jgi:uncharacterized membrane protein
MLIFTWIIAGFLIYFLFKNQDDLNSKSKNNNAEDILKAKYVKGEIDDETFNKMIKIIKE